MNKETGNKEYFVGQIIKKLRHKVRDKQSQYFKQISYKLIVETHAFIKTEQKIFVYQNIVKPNIFDALTQGINLAKRYQFFAKRSKWGWVLLDWKDL